MSDNVPVDDRQILCFKLCQTILIFNGRHFSCKLNQAPVSQNIWQCLTLRRASAQSAGYVRHVLHILWWLHKKLQNLSIQRKTVCRKYCPQNHIDTFSFSYRSRTKLNQDPWKIMKRFSRFTIELFVCLIKDFAFGITWEWGIKVH